MASYHAFLIVAIYNGVTRATGIKVPLPTGALKSFSRSQCNTVTLYFLGSITHTDAVVLLFVVVCGC